MRYRLVLSSGIDVRNSQDWRRNHVNEESPDLLQLIPCAAQVQLTVTDASGVFRRICQNRSRINEAELLQFPPPHPPSCREVSQKRGY